VRPDEDRLIYLGVLTKPHALQGGIRMLPEFDDTDDFENLKTDRVFLKSVTPPNSLRGKVTGATGEYRELILKGFTPHQQYLILFFEEATDMNAAELLRSHEVYVYEDEMWDLPEGKYYAYQLAGLELFDLITEQIAGTVKELRPGVQDYLVVDSSQGEFLVPYVPEIVVGVDMAAKRINAKLPLGINEI